MKKKRAGAGKRAATKRAKTLQAVDLMTRDPVTVPDDMTVADLCDLLQVKNINGAPVVDRRGRLVGVVAQDDIIYGAMGYAERRENGQAAGATEKPKERPAEPNGRSSAEGTTSRHKRRQVVAMLRDRHLKALPEAQPRPGEQAFWAETRKANDPLRKPVSAIMTSPAISAEETTPITDLCNVMWNLRIHRIPIVKGGRVTGLVSSMDLCRAILSGQIKV